MGGLDLGPILAGLAVEHLPAPILVLLAPETLDVRPGASLRPRRPTVPTQVRAVFASAATAGFAGFAVLGLFTAISPRIVAEVLGVGNHAVAGLVVFLLLGSSAAAQLEVRRFSTDWALDAGCALLVVGVGAASQAWGLVAAGVAFSVVAAVLAVLALIALLVAQRRRPAGAGRV